MIDNETYHLWCIRGNDECSWPLSENETCNFSWQIQSGKIPRLDKRWFFWQYQEHSFGASAVAQRQKGL